MYKSHDAGKKGRLEGTQRGRGREREKCKASEGVRLKANVSRFSFCFTLSTFSLFLKFCDLYSNQITERMSEIASFFLFLNMFVFRSRSNLLKDGVLKKKKSCSSTKPTDNYNILGTIRYSSVVNVLKNKKRDLFF